ncbi:hypothetical protein PPERSA_10675 [Pseudocohnilembus persalinus]|uniref:Serine aminopeptidase S33 domain-containing protein n=1 Tax=Pseudocohnilembus persalinus TaxID=266149 RepID=A0A0V0QDG2_PSEPJ|nr:hypothetical protein PPERSA_10675 [Pseudocohnilembus persalinus]|eukprot:KRX00176.1 hypothetical protein PPERSA_10675 [Pseudocohnilembus persalinus]
MPLEEPSNLQTLFQQEEYFLGVFENEHYKVTRKYIETVGILQRLYYTRLDPLKQITKASLVMIHGFGEHSSRFLDFAEAFVQVGYSVHLVDLRGYGYSGGARGVSLMEEMMRDVEVCMKQADENLPLFVFGHSMGGLLVLSLGCRNPNLKIAGFISSSALLGDPGDRKIEQFKKDGTNLIGDFLGDILINGMINVTSLTKNNRSLKGIIDDPHNIPFFSLKMAKSLLNTIDIIQPSAKYFNYPILLYHGQRDCITNYKDSIRFFNKIKSQDKKIQLFQTGYHEMHHEEKEGSEIEKMVVQWLDQRYKDGVKFSKDFTISTQIPHIITKQLEQIS